MLRWYVNSSLHVALAALALVRVTQFLYCLPSRPDVPLFAFSATVVAYNFIKYYESWRKHQRSNNANAAAYLTVFFLPAALFFACRFSVEVLAVLAGLAVLSAAYVLPWFGAPLRRIPGCKIFAVSFCWAVLTAVVPVLESAPVYPSDLLILFAQRFALVLVLLLIFEISDFYEDDPALKTVPHVVGVRYTKIIGLVLLFGFVALELAREVAPVRFATVFGTAFLTAVFLKLAAPERPKTFSRIYAEAIPVVWWLVLESLKFWKTYFR